MGVLSVYLSVCAGDTLVSAVAAGLTRGQLPMAHALLLGMEAARWAVQVPEAIPSGLNWDELRRRAGLSEQGQLEEDERRP